MATHMSLSFTRSHVAILLPSPPRDKHHRHRSWKRRRIKPVAPRRSHVSNNLFDQTSDLTYVAPTIFTLAASGLALLLSPKSSSSSPSDLNPDLHPDKAHISNPDLGEWVLFTSPTPFNRFVTLRCPSIYFPEHLLLDDVNEKLVEEDRHYVRLHSGRIIIKGSSGDDDTDVEIEENVVYQRICVAADDGGVIALDWPANLELEEERGLDTTVLIVPGTAEGSNERKIRVFVCECLRRGVFPVVMNPRGCAGSPLTTARLFTAADSDDVSTAVQFISKKRPWTTLMGVGWGYGANILTKYLAESGEKTPLTAATCIDNPFDMEEATRSLAHHMDYDKLHTSGLISILESNKELFQGRGKGFDVETALSASSIRDFDKAISMVSYGHNTLEDFYAKSSTRDLVGELKIPVLFIQNDDGTVPMFSIPRSLIAENPYTSLLLCSYSSSGNSIKTIYSFSWCQNLTVEWLGAVELGLLKGRHPLLKDVDVTINPSKRLMPLGNISFDRSGRMNTLLNPNNGSSATPSLKMFKSNDITRGIQSKYIKDTGGSPYNPNGLQLENNNVGSHSSGTIDAEIEDVNSLDRERGQVVQTAEVVMNMLDLTMPNTLSDEQKKKVLNAVGQGETLLNALQDAVPEDVRGKLTSAVSGILQNQGSNLKLDQLLNLGHIPDVGSELNTKVLEKMSRLKRNDGKDAHSSEQKKRSNDHADGSAKVDHGMSGDLGYEKQSSHSSQKPSDIGTPQSSVDHGSNTSESEKVTLNNNEKHPIENDQLAGIGIPQSSDRENASQITANQESSDFLRRPSGSDDFVVDQQKEERDTSKPVAEQTEESNAQRNDNTMDQHKASGDHQPEEKSPTQSPPQPEPADNANNNKIDFSTAADKESEASGEDDKSSSLAPTSENRAVEGEEQNNHKKEEKNPTSSSNQNTGRWSGFNVSQALDALTEFDDSTQVAVNSVFNVIEGMIDQLDGEDNKNGVDNEDDDSKIYVPEKVPKHNGHTPETSENSRNSPRTRSDGSPLNNSVDSGQKYVQRSLSCNGQNGRVQNLYFEPAGGSIRASNSAKFSQNSSENFPNYQSTLQYGDPLYKEYLKAYLYSKLTSAKPPDVDRLAALYLDYMPDEVKWKLLEKTKSIADFPNKYNNQEVVYGKEVTSESKHTDNVIEPSYVILDSSEEEEQNPGPNHMQAVNENTNQSGEINSEDSLLFVKGLILQSLNAELSRRISAADMEELELNLAEEVENVANSVSLAARHIKLPNGDGDDNVLQKYGTLDGENIINAITSSFEDSKYLRRVLPVGVIVGTTLAALRKFFNVAAVNGDDENDSVSKSTETLVQADEENNGEKSLNETEKDENLDHSSDEDTGNINHEIFGNNKMMVGAATAGAVTAALGASALLVYENIDTDGSSNDQLNDKKNGRNAVKLDESADNDNIVTSLAEKAMSVASPMVPMKEDGKVDQERLVAMLADLGQKGGVLKLVAKVALLWGGIRGAMSLTDKLISFLRIAERPLVQRILGFVGMVLLLWAPVVIPLLPTLMQSWAARNPLKIAEFACIVGLYVSIMIMITLWGKRIRKYDDPLHQYGLDLASVPKIQNFLIGLVGGVALVLLIHSVNASLGCVHFCWPATLSSSANAPMSLFKSYGHMLLLIIQGTAIATCVSVVEELLFRSWLPQEVAADLGYHQGIIISGFLFALSQRSAWEIPGLWLLSLSLSGAQKRDQGSLALPIGLRTGILACNHILRRGGFLTYQPYFPLWVTGRHSFQPFSGVVGLAFSLLLAVILYPRQPYGKKTMRVIKE